MPNSSTSDLIQQLYVAYFGRPADPAGLAYWTSQVQAAQGDIGVVLSAFSGSAESKALYPGSSSAQIVSAIYQNLFNRAPEAEGLAYWIHALETGALSSAAMAYAIMQGALGSDATALENKQQAARAFVAELDTAQEVAGYSGLDVVAAARQFLQTVGASPQSLAAALAADALKTAIAKATGTYVPPAPEPAPEPAPAPAPAPDTQAPSITSIAITSASGVQNNTLNADDVLSVTVTMSEATTVTGNPQLALNIGGTTVQAQYASGSGSTALVFSYTIQAGQTDADGISIAANSLALNNGTLQDAAGNSAILSHSAVANNASYKVDNTTPTIASIAITSASGVQNNTLNAGDVLSVTVTMSEATTVTGTPQLALNIGGTTVQAQYASGSGSTALVFSYTIQAGQTDADGISIAANSLALNGGTLQDAADNSASLSHSAVAGNTSYRVDTTAPVATLLSMVQLEPLGNSTGSDSYPQVSALGSDGAFVVTWQGHDSGGDDSIFVQKFNADGTTSGDLVQLEPLGKVDGNDAFPQVSALGSDGAFVVTWYGTDTGGDNSIFVQKFNAQGTTSGDPVQLEPLGKADGYDTHPQVSALGSDGAFVVTWQGNDSDSDLSIFVQKFNADGTRSTTSPVQLEPLGKTNGHDQYPQVSALGSGGAFVVTWQGQDSTGGYSISVQKFNADGMTSGDPVQLEPLGATKEAPQVSALGSDGAFVVTWQGKYSAVEYLNIFVQKFNADGTTVQLKPLGKTNGDDLSPQVSALGSDGAFVVTWYGYDSDSDIGGDDSIFVQKFDADGTTSGDPVQLEAPGRANGFDQYPQVSALGSDGAFVVTWNGPDSVGDNSIFVQKFNAQGQASGAIVQLEALGVSIGADYKPQVSALGSDGAFVVTWYGSDMGGDNSIFVQKFNAQGQPDGNVLRNDSTPVYVRSSEAGKGYLVKSSITVNTLSDITSQPDTQWNQGNIIATNTDTAISTTGLEDGSYRLYTSDAAGNLSVVAVGVVTIDMP